MPRFQIKSVDTAFTGELEAQDPAAALHAIQRAGCTEADVLCDYVYCFSARIGENGLWYIFHRERDVEPVTVPSGWLAQ